MQFNKAEEWTVKGKTFSVQIRHWTSPEYKYGDMSIVSIENKWNVYALIWDTHPLFNRFSLETKMYDESCQMLPMHGGATYIEPLQGRKGIHGWKIGCDYNHLNDSYFTKCSTKEDAYEVFEDAKHLYEWLENFEKEA